MSRASRPKQLLALTSSLTMLQETATRVRAAGFAPPIVICNDEYRFVVAHQMQEAGLATASIVLEPDRRNTAPSAAIAALMAIESDPAALLAILPSDHQITDDIAFRECLKAAVPAARAGRIVVFGVAPTFPATGYGYIESGDPLRDAPNCCVVSRFVEKPDRAAAEALLAAGTFRWNSGIFLCEARTILAELERNEPELVSACRSAIAMGRRDLDFFRLDRSAFLAAKAISIDRAVMERTERGGVVTAMFPWSDLGSWNSLWDSAQRDEAGNAVSGEVVVHDVTGSYLRSEGPLVAALGVRDLVIVATADAVLVAPRGRAQEVGVLVERMRADGRTEHADHLVVHRPWGTYQTVDVGEGFQVKHILIRPGARISKQYHLRRAEHWVVVQGTAHVTRGETNIVLQQNESTYISVGEIHCLENLGPEPLRVIEIQTGSYLGEDDIVRLDDRYGRVS